MWTRGLCMNGDGASTPPQPQKRKPRTTLPTIPTEKETLIVLCFYSNVWNRYFIILLYLSINENVTGQPGTLWGPFIKISTIGSDPLDNNLFLW